MRDRRGQTLKRRAYDLLEVGGAEDGAARAVERVLVVLVVVNLVAVLLETVPEIGGRHALLFTAIEVGTAAVFAVEYAVRVWVATLHLPLARLSPTRARLTYMAGPGAIIDLLSFAPTVLGFALGFSDVNVLVVFRLLRFLKLARYSPGMHSLMTALRTERRALVATAVLMLGLILTAATLMYLIERHGQPERFGSIPLAMYWAVTTLTTVGYGDAVPLTAAGKLLAGATMLAGLCMFALPVGIIATAFSREIHTRDFVVTWGMVARVPIFQQLQAAEITEVTRLLRAQTVAAGGLIVRRGDPALAMYFIASGTVEVDVPGQAVRLGEGAFFGEMALLRKGRRSADVVAVTACRLMVLEAADLAMLTVRQPEIGAHIRAVAEARRRAAPRARGDLLPEELQSGERGRDEPDGRG